MDTVWCPESGGKQKGVGVVLVTIPFSKRGMVLPLPCIGDFFAGYHQNQLYWFGCD